MIVHEFTAGSEADRRHELEWFPVGAAWKQFIELHVVFSRCGMFFGPFESAAGEAAID